jgi:intein/homing endonuclease
MLKNQVVSFADELIKISKVKTKLQPHQQRVVDRISQEDQPGLVVAHSVGAGKCVRGDTPIMTNRGLVKIQELFGEDKIGPEEELVLPPKGLEVASYVDGTYVWSKVRSLYRQKLLETENTLRVTTLRGSTVEITKAHPLLVVREGSLKWVSSSELLLGDSLAVAKSLPESSNTDVSEELALLLSWQISEGWESDTTNSAMITQDDMEVLLLIQGLFRGLFPTSTSGQIRTPKEHCPYIDIICADYKKLLESTGYTWGYKSAQKKFPYWYTLLDKKILSKVLRAIWDAEGHAAKGCLEFSSASMVLILQVQYALLRFGIRSSFHSKWACATNGTKIKRLYHRICISGEDVPLFVEHVGFDYAYKQEAAILVANKDKNPNHGVPVGHLITRLRELGIFNVCSSGTVAKVSCSEKTVSEIEGRIRWLVSPEGENLYRAKVAKGGGTANMFSKRTLSVLLEYREELLEIADKLHALNNSNLRFEPIKFIEQGKLGGFVYDLEVDSDTYDHKNYIAGVGGIILHNTLTSISAQDALGLDSDVIVPAALQENYKKELLKHHDKMPKNVKIKSMQNMAVKGEAPSADMMIVDEAHRARDPASKSYKTLAQNTAKKRLLLTGSPIYNHPADIAPLVNLAAGDKILPADRAEFEKQYIMNQAPEVGIIDRIRGIERGYVPALRQNKKEELSKKLNKWVDYHEGTTTDFPTVTREDVPVNMTSEQLQVYDTLMGKAPSWVQHKIKSGLPPSKRESTQLNNFLSGVRQVSNSTGGYQTEGSQDPKIERAFQEFKKNMDANPNAKAVIYSNFLESGLDPYMKRLKDAGIPYGEFSGRLPKKERDELVRQYNDNKLRALFLSSAGGEGLDLKGTRLLQIMEPHWNEMKSHQIEGRGIRYKSHADLPEEERNIKVQRFLATRPRSGIMEKLHLSKPGMGVDEYLTQMSKNKTLLNKQFTKLLRDNQVDATKVIE